MSGGDAVGVEELNRLWEIVEPRMSAAYEHHDARPDKTAPDWGEIVSRERALAAAYWEHARSGRKLRNMFYALWTDQSAFVKKLAAMVFIHGGDAGVSAGAGWKKHDAALPEAFRVCYREETALLEAYRGLAGGGDAILREMTARALAVKAKNAERLVAMAGEWFG